MERPRLIGYWRNEQHPEYPDPTVLVDEAWDEDERAGVAGYLADGTVAAAMMGRSPCRICGRNNGSLEFTDGHYRWPEGLAHYVEDHAVRLPDEVVRHALDRLRVVETAEPDLSWWLDQYRA